MPLCVCVSQADVAAGFSMTLQCTEERGGVGWPLVGGGEEMEVKEKFLMTLRVNKSSRDRWARTEV